MTTNATTPELVDRVREALASADLDAFADLLAPGVTWGAGGAPPGCRNRRQVLDWYRKGRAQGRRARAVDVIGRGDKILVSMQVTEPLPTGEGGAVDRWQVLTVSGGRIRAIEGFDDGLAARRAAGVDD